MINREGLGGYVFFEEEGIRVRLNILVVDLSLNSVFEPTVGSDEAKEELATGQR